MVEVKRVEEDLNVLATPQSGPPKSSKAEYLCSFHWMISLSFPSLHSLGLSYVQARSASRYFSTMMYTPTLWRGATRFSQSRCRRSTTQA